MDIKLFWKDILKQNREELKNIFALRLKSIGHAQTKSFRRMSLYASIVIIQASGTVKLNSLKTLTQGASP